MNNFSNHMEAILNHSISGYHRYILSGSAHLVYVSRDLCRMLDTTEEELLDALEKKYKESHNLMANALSFGDYGKDGE